MSILGIDPGLDGALAIIDGASVKAVFDMPTHELTVNKKKQRLVDDLTAIRWIDLNCLPGWLAIIEDVHAMPRQGISSAFKFGRSTGNIETAVGANLLCRVYVSPGVWKKAMGLSADKDASRRQASQLFPAFSHLWPLKKHDGRAEAVLLAHYGSRFL